MNRRTFLKKSGGSILLLNLTHPFISCDRAIGLRFGIVTDLHYAGKEPRGTRYFNQSGQKLREAIDIFNRSNLDFLIELGDFKDQDDEPKKEKTLIYLEEAEAVFQTFRGPKYHVLGNHDMDSISKEEFMSRITNHRQQSQQTYYSFVAGGVKCMVLDANYNLDGSPYDSGNFDWTKAFIPTEQKEWLRKELTGHTYPVLVFIHQLLDVFSGVHKSVCVSNATEIVSVLEEHGNVLAVFQGHHHPGHYSFRNGIHYWTMKGMIEGGFPGNNSFATIELDKKGNIHIEGFANCEDRDLPRVQTCRGEG